MEKHYINKWYYLVGIMENQNNDETKLSKEIVVQTGASVYVNVTIINFLLKNYN